MEAAIDMLEAKLRKLENHYMNEKTLSYKCLNIPDTFSHIDETHESWCHGDFDQDSISKHQLELDKSQILDKLASFHFKKIELDCKCELYPQLCDSVLIFESMLTPVSLPNLDPIPEPTLFPIPIYLEIELPILNSHITLMDHECELKFFDLEPTIESKLTLELKIDLSHIRESVLVPVLFILEPNQPFHQIIFCCWTKV